MAHRLSANVAPTTVLQLLIQWMSGHAMSARQLWRVIKNSNHYPTLAQRLVAVWDINSCNRWLVSKFSDSKIATHFLFFPAKLVIHIPHILFGTLHMAKTSSIIEINVGFSLVCWKKTLKALSLILTNSHVGQGLRNTESFILDISIPLEHLNYSVLIKLLLRYVCMVADWFQRI